MTKEKQIEELRDLIMVGSRLDVNSATAFAETLYQRGYRKQSEWISVDERLPNENFEWVLVAFQLIPEGDYGVSHIAQLRHGVWYADCYDIPLENAGVKVTHWMPLPEPPKMKGGAE